MDNFDPYNVLLAIATNIPVLLMTAFVLQGHIYFFLFIRNIPKCVNYIMKYLDSQICVSKCILHLL